MPFMTWSVASMANWPNLPKTLGMSRALSAPAPVTSVSCRATCSSTKDAACRADIAKDIASNNTAAMSEAPAIRAMLIDKCAIGCLIAPAPAARFRPAAAASPSAA
eukprot:13677812-Alexandrium_andersonii.AAC.1